MSKVAVVFAPGFEEMEGLTAVDVLRRAEIEVSMIGFTEEVTGSHGITVKMDRTLDDSLAAYDMLILPGGMPGAENLKNNSTVIKSLQDVYDNGKQVAAVCAAPIVLEAAGLLKDKNYTVFPGFEEQIHSGNHSEMIVVTDGRVTTSRGPATALAFSYQLVDKLGGDSEKIKEAMQYNKLVESFQKKV